MSLSKHFFVTLSGFVILKGPLHKMLKESKGPVIIFITIIKILTIYQNLQGL